MPDIRFASYQLFVLGDPTSCLVASRRPDAPYADLVWDRPVAPALAQSPLALVVERKVILPFSTCSEVVLSLTYCSVRDKHYPAKAETSILGRC